MKKNYIDRCTYFRHGIIVTVQKVIGRVRTRRNLSADAVYLWDEVFRLDSDEAEAVDFSTNLQFTSFVNSENLQTESFSSKSRGTRKNHLRG